ncbi:PH domain-containing protein [Bacillus sp. WLY-B-L8]|uniref:PH domain-containing protein n=1 Tax=Bacillus multifaciens TaxID=3068506 RepID=UPI002741DFDB|nr:PH domain-containing protein [Bacillus sp. WLY-B-L8]MDP7978534.1 PH domain-containing protein [Bacillus sp. WLY-B-L8]
MYKRQHPITILFEVKLSSILPVFFVFVVKDGTFPFWYLIPLLFIGAGIIFNFISWYYKMYWVENNVLHIKEGLFTKKESYLNKERVQTINTSSNILYQILGLTRLKIETAGGDGEAEVQLAGITREEAANLIAMLNKNSDVKDAPELEVPSIAKNEHTAVAYTLTWKEILLASITSGKFGLLFSILFVLSDKIRDIMPNHIVKKIEHYVETYVSESDIVGWGYMIVALLLLSWIVSTIQYALQHANFTISRKRDEIRISQGLLERKELVLKAHRIHGIKMKEGILRKPFGYCSVHVEAIQKFEEGQTDVTIHPLMKKKKVLEMLQYLQLPYDINSEMTKLPKTAMRRHMLDNFIFACIVAVPIIGSSIYFHKHFLLALLLPLFLVSIWLGYAQYKAGGYRIDGDQLTMSYRGIAKYTVFVKRRHIQSLKKSQSYFQKKDALCTYNFHNASAGHTLEHVRMEDAEKMQSWYKRGL